MKIKVCILDYGSGNQRSVSNLLDLLEIPNLISHEKKDIESSSHLILPGVGSYPATMNKINNRNFLDILKKELFIKKKLFLGICVGMQVLTENGFEFEKILGLNFIKGRCTEIKNNPNSLPHIGWNNINIKKNDSIFKNITEEDNFYFLNSYKCEIENENILSTTYYNEEFVSILNKENIYGFQFHPEKSQNSGIKIMRNFLKI